MRTIVITCSDRASKGKIEDESGPAVRDVLEKNGFEVIAAVVVSDDRWKIASTIRRAVDNDKCRLVVTTGGTGIGPRDVTPDATDMVTTKKLPGFGELMRLRSLEKTRFAALSRAQAAVRGEALVINLPGSPDGAVETLEAVIELIPHALKLLAGETAH